MNDHDNIPSNQTPASRVAPSSAPINPPLTKAEIQGACVRANLPVILALQQAANLIGLKPSTLTKKVCQGYFDDCAHHGKPLRFWTERLLLRVMNQR